MTDEEKKRCRICGKTEGIISSTLGVCLGCIKNFPEKALAKTREAHKKIRARFHLPAEPPKDARGIQCTLCANECTIGEGQYGYCGLRRNEDGKLIQPSNGLLLIYYDPHPTNCCAAWFCSGKNIQGKSLAVFPYGCSFDCMFCQNFEHKMINRANRVSVDELVTLAENATCLCYFGGTPEPQFPFLLKATKKILETKPIRICWEWNGTGNQKLVKKATEYSYDSDGVIKFDLKAYDRNLHIALTGRPNDRTQENFRFIAENFEKKNLLTATTLLIPGYIDSSEIGHIARFISKLNPDIPYSLLAFHPDYTMMDLPVTSRTLAMECYDAACRYLNHVNIGNKHLLW